MSLHHTAWTNQNLANPHAIENKAQRVQAMFSAIAPRYDLNNRIHSLGQDQAWRRLAANTAAVRKGDVVLDVACGTGDLALAFATGPASRVLAVDFTYNMLAEAQHKQATANTTVPHYQVGDALRLPIASESVDVVSIAFGIRNVTDPIRAIEEFYRVLRPGGRLIILEFSEPTHRWIRALYHFYFKRIMPHTASWIAWDRSGAYKYLPRSVSTFLDPQAITQAMQTTGFRETLLRRLTFGIAVLYRGIKPPPS